MSSKITKKRRGSTDTLDSLNAQQAIFVKELLTDPAMNATEAARRAGYSSPERTSNKLLKHKVVSAEIAKAIDKRSHKLEITADRVLREIYSIAMFNLQDLLDDKGDPIPLKKLPRDVAAALTSHTIIYRKGPDGQRYPNVESVQVSKLAALDLLCKHLGIANDRIDVSLEHKIKFDFDKLYGAPDDEPDLIEQKLKNPLVNTVPGRVIDVKPIKREEPTNAESQ